MSGLTPAIFLMGPTAVGKSQLAMELAEKFPIEIISVDSAMVYRGMTIGTNKPSADDQQKVPHHLLDIRDPLVAYSAAEFARDALELMQAIKSRDRIPVLVGGTMFYFRVLLSGMAHLPKANPEIRSHLLEAANREGWPAMHKRLNSIDPKSASRIHPNDAQRIQRALEIYEVTHKTMSEWFAEQAKTQNTSEGIGAYDIHQFARVPTDRKILHQKIEERFYVMLEEGLVEEVEALFKRGDLDNQLPSIRSVGYRQVWDYLSGEFTYEEMIPKAIAATRQLAKRQLTWIRGLEEVIELKNTHLASLQTVIDSIK